MDLREFQEANEEGLIDDDRAADYISANIATKDELRELIDIGVFTIQNILNGRYNAEQEPRVIELMRTWNVRFGFRFFLTV